MAFSGGGGYVVEAVPPELSDAIEGLRAVAGGADVGGDFWRQAVELDVAADAQGVLAAFYQGAW